MIVLVPSPFLMESYGMLKRSWMMSLLLVTLFPLKFAYADVVLMSGVNACQDVVGHWSGTAIVSSRITGDCLYRGNGIVDGIDARGNFSFHLQANKDKGSDICPANVNHTLSANCVNGAITLKTNYGNLTGTMSGKTGHASGKVSFMGLSAKISVQLQKV